MYKTCIFCKKPLGANEVVEAFPVGRRLAFDAAKGRLWVICRKCRRWNLTPMEERWEAIEECERLFRGTRARVSTENIGIARHREGLELVRIGSPRRPEFAAWRYGDQMGERRRRSIVTTAIGLGGGALMAPAILTSPPLVVVPIVWVTCIPVQAWLYLRPVVRVPVGREYGRADPVRPEDTVKFRVLDLLSTALVPHADEPGFAVQIRKGGQKTRFVGEDARRVAAAIVPQLNGAGGRRRAVQDAVGRIESSGHSGRFLFDVAREIPRRSGRVGYLRTMPKPTRLALEMALHEEQERRALEGELWVLEQAWKEAEEIAAIADSLLLPARSAEFFERYGGSCGSPASGP